MRFNIDLLSCPVLVRTNMPTNNIAAILSAEKIREFDRDIRGFKLGEEGDPGSMKGLDDSGRRAATWSWASST